MLHLALPSTSLPEPLIALRSDGSSPVRCCYNGSSGPVDDADEAQLDRDDSAHQDVHGVRAGVHQVQLGHHSQRPPAWGGTRSIRPFSSK